MDADVKTCGQGWGVCNDCREAGACRWPVRHQYGIEDPIYTEYRRRKESGSECTCDEDGPDPACPMNAEPKAPPTILEEAESLVGQGGDRNDAYDHPIHNFTKIAKVWEVILGCPVSTRQVALCMIGMKVVRDAHKARRDNIVDIAGYARCVERLDEFPHNDNGEEIF